MKVFGATLFALSLSAQAFAAPIEERQNDPVSVIFGAVNRELSRVLVELFYINGAITSLQTINAPSVVATLNNNLAAVVSSLSSASSTLSATDIASCTSGTVTSGDITGVINSLTTANTIVSGIQNALTKAATSLSSANLAAIASNVLSLESQLSTFGSSIQSYGNAILPCAGTVAPSLVSNLGNTINLVSDTVQGLLDSLNAGGALNGLVLTIIPRAVTV